MYLVIGRSVVGDELLYLCWAQHPADVADDLFECRSVSHCGNLMRILAYLNIMGCRLLELKQLGSLKQVFKLQSTFGHVLPVLCISH
jgi:hypothetical protein